MTENASRQPKGIPTGGQFAATTHAEPALNLAPRRPQLDGWPESLPEPEVDVTVGDDNAITTTVSIDGESVMEVWHDDDDVHDTDATVFESKWLGNQDVAEAAEQWARAKHTEIASELRAEMHAAVERSRARVLAAATGETKPATDDELAATIERNGNAARQALRDMELASAGLAARKILAAHPSADTAEIQTDSWDNGEFVSGAIVRDSGYNRLTEYFEDDDNPEVTKEVVGLLKNLGAEPHNSHWAEAFSTGSYGENIYTIDLKKAAAWSSADGATQPETAAPTPAAQIDERPCTDGPWCAAPRGQHNPGCTMEMM